MTVTLVAVMFVAAAMVGAGAFAGIWRRDLTAALAAVPLLFGGAAIAFAGVARFSAASGPELIGQEVAVLLAVCALALYTLGIGLAGRGGRS